METLRLPVETAMPSDVRKAFGLPAISDLDLGSAQLGAQPPWLFKKLDGSAERFRTSIGVADLWFYLGVLTLRLSHKRLVLLKAQRTELLKLLPEHGWSVTSLEENLEWWADEMWQLASVWSPVGHRAWVTFLVDPMFEGNRNKGEAVWAVMASPTKPSSWNHEEDDFTLSLGQGWKNRLPEFFNHLAACREKGPRA